MKINCILSSELNLYAQVGTDPSMLSAPAVQSPQWYAWGPPNMQCRLCASCWIYWKKYGGLKTPTQLEGAARASTVRLCSHPMTVYSVIRLDRSDLPSFSRAISTAVLPGKDQLLVGNGAFISDWSHPDCLGLIYGLITMLVCILYFITYFSSYISVEK